MAHPGSMQTLVIRIGRPLTRAALLGALAIGGARAEQHNPAVGPLGEREIFQDED